MTDVTCILSAIEQGDPHAAEQLLPLVYDELRKLAAQKLAQEKPGQTLQATALVHEAYLRLVDTEKAQHWNSRGHFFAAAANDGPSTAATASVSNSRKASPLPSGGTTSSPSTRHSPGLPARNRRRPNSSSYATSPACRCRKRPPAWAFLRPPPNATGSSPAPGCTRPCRAQGTTVRSNFPEAVSRSGPETRTVS
jgi:hypothetical protein